MFPFKHFCEYCIIGTMPSVGSLIGDVQQFLDFCRVEKGLAANSLEAYGRDLACYQQFSGEGSVPEDAGHIRRYMDSLYKSGLGSRSVARHLTTLRNFYRFLLQEGRVSEDPTALLASPKQWNSLPKYLTINDINKLVKESEFIVTGKIDNIYQTETKDLFLQIYVSGKPKQLLRIVAGKCFYLVSKRPPFDENMHRFCSYLRKYILNSRIISFEQVDYERIIKFTLETKESKYELYAELFGKGNTVLVKEGKIVSVAEEQVWADRILKSGEVYSYPQREDQKEMFEKQKIKGSTVSMAELEKEFSSIGETKKQQVKNKEITKIENTLEIQEKHLKKILEEAESNKKKGELIYEKYQELNELFEKAKSLKGKSEEEITKDLKNYKLL